MLGTCRFLPWALLLAVTALPSAGVAQQPTKATIVQMHAVIGVGEEVFLYAVPSNWATSRPKASTSAFKARNPVPCRRK
jgi:hypothetical protein